MTESNASLPVIPPGVTNLELLDARDGAFGVKGSGDTSGFGGLVDPRVMPGASQAPFGGWFDEVAEEIELSLADQGLPFASATEKVVVDRGEITFFVRREHLLAFVRVLRDEPGLRFEMCSGVSGVHYPSDAGRELLLASQKIRASALEKDGFVFEHRTVAEALRWAIAETRR